ncbi:GIY-YIG nuclease family protein [Maribellus sediminis]|uniref:GIY-YIG nuclease family protein n=1 Tax=Maribellus sediminis TaxID=2696285 RepID=UPI001F0D1843|nr:GIY-YIG nuclease family protein [Maribellus sediminis]
MGKEAGGNAASLFASLSLCLSFRRSPATEESYNFLVNYISLPEVIYTIFLPLLYIYSLKSDIIMNQNTYFIYFLTNWNKNVLYVGVTNNLSRRLTEHLTGKFSGFTKKYNCNILVYYEEFEYINNAILREKEIKSWRREKKNALIENFNPKWEPLNHRFLRE